MSRDPQRRCSGWLRATLLGLCLWAGAAHAADFTVMEYRGKRVILLQDEKQSRENPNGGMIKAGDAQRFDKALREAMPVSEVLLDSRGGSEKDGLAIGRAIRRAGVSTRIPKGAMCASACADIFMGGVARRVEDGGRYGIHMATMVNDPEFVDKIYQAVASAYDQNTRKVDRGEVRKLIQFFEQRSAMAAARWGAFVLEMGGSPRIVDLGTQSKAAEMNWLTREQMLDLNVVNVDN